MATRSTLQLTPGFPYCNRCQIRRAMIRVPLCPRCVLHAVDEHKQKGISPPVRVHPRLAKYLRQVAESE